jgi:hypothetical protein
MSRRATLLAAVLAVATLATVASAASAHITTRGGDWYFHGSIFHQDSFAPKVENDPINFIWYGGRTFGSEPSCRQPNDASAPSHNDLCIFNHMTSAFPAMRRSICDKQKIYNPQYIAFTDHAGKRDFTKQGHELYTARAKGVDPCPNGYHIRFWRDHTHADQTGAAHGYTNQWQLGGVHYDRRVGFKHLIGMDWDDARVNIYKQTTGRGNGTGSEKYCGSRRWQVHPGAAGKFQKFTSTGTLSRVGTTPTNRVTSCDGQ